MELKPTSPPRQQVLLSHDSPVHAKRVHNSRSYQSGQLEDARLVVLEELGTRIPQITLQDFMDFLAPPQPEFDIDDGEAEDFRRTDRLRSVESF